MNWDWDKLQEKRQRQNTGRPPSNNDDNGSNRNSGPPKNPFDKIDLGKMLPKFSSGIPVMPVVVVLILLWLASGIFTVNPGEVGVVTFFGKYDRTVNEGLHYRLPFPIESRQVVNTALVRTIEIGVSSEKIKVADSKAVEESSIFTGDENIIHMQFNVQYTVENAYDYLYKVQQPNMLVRTASEAAMREAVGSSDVDSILRTNRAGVQSMAQNALQEILNGYESGIRIHSVQLLDVQPPAEVAEAFRDVASAREDRERLTSQAEAYRNSIVPIAEGTAKGLVNAASAYKETVVLNAQGEAERFLAMVHEYNNAKDVTMKRLRLEAMQEVLSSQGMDKVILSKDAKGGFLPFMNLDKGTSGKLPAAPSSSSKPAPVSGMTGQGASSASSSSASNVRIF